MRKADYAALAAIIRRRLADSRASGQIAAESELRLTAFEIARTLSVNRTEFLKACGIDT